MLSFRYNFYDMIESDSDDEETTPSGLVINKVHASPSTQIRNEMLSPPASSFCRSPETSPVPITKTDNDIRSELDLDQRNTKSNTKSDASYLQTYKALQETMVNLKIDSKLPNFNNLGFNQLIIPSKDSKDTNVLHKGITQDEYVTNQATRSSSIGSTKYLVSELISSISERFESIEIANKKEVARILSEKKRKEQERIARIEEECKRKEEEARRLKEEEEHQRRELAAKKKADEERIKQEQLKAEQDAKKEEEARTLKLKKEAEEKAKEEVREANRNKYSTNFKNIEKTFLKYKEQIQIIKKEIVEPVKNIDKDQKKILSTHRRKINPKFGQLTNSNQQLIAVANELDNLISQTTSQPLMFKWILNFVAKAIVHQAENEVRVKPESALPLAKLALYLVQKFPDLKELLMARFVKKCPFVIGYTCSIDTENGRSAMGWKRNSENKWEASTSYDERIGGMVTLFSVITRLDTMVSGSQNPWSLEYSWMMLARIANTPVELLTNVHFIVLGSWWDATASSFLQRYGNQGAKLMRLIGDGLTSSVAEKKYVGAARLRILMEDWISNNNITAFPEMDP
ncbi:similar to Saccharomyces cerevisiae YDL207W GLE1 Cytoplasmic nucleoporin required for polyadenylated RNA export [Maudiozyma barnettii]|uniref:mRNA export factor GLE1 n=1 Tax=Maudiozyma barnettii TaxID=61262 RepID=A0A8H2VH88_9SACH|nr:nucleoporin GLE1 [Kazachstania barnettii]CAB4255164.1 similar to Saccharomyces cerevisiae YDL207W GLE1 Cytoplasmic nucleoporin required for polyadenylated RNA export [Kazachstania barnettii]CAD1783435.1 similar to Saccharomyces cerevisiae YDL207W GLE1 Cytoplasmic nucleoporin required for polyadenylated RNA export [Kazachstania barnettii]